MRWTKRIWTTALVLAGLAGCKQQCYIKECDWNSDINRLTTILETKPDASQPACPSVVHLAPARTVLDPDRPPRYLSLAEATSISLEHGNRGFDIGGAGSDGRDSDSLARFRGIGSVDSQHIRVLALDPAIAQTQIEAALSKFDASFTTAMSWNSQDRPSGGSLFDSINSGGANDFQQDEFRFESKLIKPLPTGGAAQISFSGNRPPETINLGPGLGSPIYTFNKANPTNPSYTPFLQFRVEQPLLQGFGVEMNQLRAAHPVTGAAPTQEGILLTRIRYDQSRADFEASVNNMVLNVENAYWNLYGTYWNLYSRELGLRLAYDFWRITRDKQLLGGAKGTKLADLARARGQYELFRSQRIDALARVLEAERQLRKLLGMPVEDGQRLVPSDTPTLSPYQPDYQSAVGEALALRPELVIAREELKVRQLALTEVKNFLMPDLRAHANYDVNSLGNRLDGSGNDNALRNLVDDKFNQWGVGLSLNMPLGPRVAYANVRRARLELARGAALLKDQEDKAVAFLAWQYRRLYENYEQIKAQRAQREAYGLVLRLAQLEIGERATLGDQAILEAQRFFAEALAGEYNAIVQYNNSLATFEYAKGTLLRHNNILIGAGDLPECASERAVDHYAKRSAALVVRHRPVPLSCSDGSCGKPGMIPELPKNRAADLPTILDTMPRTPDDEMSDLPSMDKPVPGSPVSSRSVPPARAEEFGTARMMPSSVLTRDSAPSLSSASLGSPVRP